MPFREKMAMPYDMVIFGLAVFGKNSAAWTEALHKEVCRMRKKNFKGRCEKRVIAKCSEVCRTYDPIQYAYADVLQKDDAVRDCGELSLHKKYDRCTCGALCF